ncbi:unnamed protein product, partial [Larinioides sclopetarius]
RIYCGFKNKKIQHLHKNWKSIQKGYFLLKKHQFSHPHTRGSSHGESRLIRTGYAEPFFCEMMPHAFRMWSELELEVGKTLMVNTGVIGVAKSPGDLKTYQAMIDNMKKYCPESLDMSDPRIETLFSRLLKFDKLHGVMMDSSGGILLAQKAVLAIQALFRERGGTQWDNSPVQKIEPIGEEEVKLHVDFQRVVKAKSVVVCAGAWTPKLLSPFATLPLQPSAVKVYYWRSKEKGAYSEKSGFPCFIDVGELCIYGLPSYEYPDLVKVCIHAGNARCDPNERDKAILDPKIEKKLKDYVREHFPLLEAEPAIIETCMYTLTPDEIFLIDTLTKHKNIVVGSGFSGTGFKTSPAVGKLLSQMAMGTETFLDITPYKLARFQRK